MGTLRSKLAVSVARFLPQTLKNQFHHNRSLDHISRWLFHHALGQASFFSIEKGPLAGARLANSEHISHAHIRGTYETATLTAIDKLVRPGDVCYDLGASIGYLSLLMARKAKHVFCFEPAPHAAGEIRKHMAANGFKNFTIVPSPVTDGVREVRFALTDVTYGSGIVERDTQWPELKLTSTTLDRFSSDHPVPDFVKIDVEGEEDRVLAGAGELLSRNTAVFCCELHSREDMEQCREIFMAHQYWMTGIDGKLVNWDGPIVAGEFHIVAFPPRN